MFRLVDKLADHGLDDANVAIEDATEGSAQQGHPKALGEANDEEGKKSASTTKEKHGLPTDAVAQSTPVHAAEGLSEGKGRDENARVESSIVLVGDIVVEDKLPCIGKDGSKRNWLCDSDEGCCWSQQGGE